MRCGVVPGKNSPRFHKAEATTVFRATFNMAAFYQRAGHVAPRDMEMVVNYCL